MSTEQTTPTLPSDAELFQQSMTPDPEPSSKGPAPSQPDQPQPSSEPPAPPQQGYADKEPVRDEHGRFTGEYRSKPPEQQAAQPIQPPTEDDKSPPSHRWKEMREELEAERRQRREYEFALYDRQQRERALQEQIAKLQPQQKPQVPDPITDPEGYHSYVENRFNGRLREQEQNFSFRMAHDRHGEEFEHAYGEMIARAERGDPSVVRTVMASPDPGQAMIGWYRRETNLAQLGPHDPKTWAKEVWLREQMKDPQFQGWVLEQIRGSASQAQQPNGPGGGPVQLPPSLNRMAAAAPVQAVNGDMSDTSLFDFAFRQGRSSR